MIRKTGSGEARRKFIRMSSLEPQPRTEYRVSRKELLWIVGSAGITLLALALLANSTSLFKRSNRSEEHTSELQSRLHLVCRLLLEKKKENTIPSVDPTPPAFTWSCVTLPVDPCAVWPPSGLTSGDKRFQSTDICLGSALSTLTISQ